MFEAVIVMKHQERFVVWLQNARHGWLRDMYLYACHRQKMATSRFHGPVRQQL